MSKAALEALVKTYAAEMQQDAGDRQSLRPWAAAHAHASPGDAGRGPGNAPAARTPSCRTSSISPGFLENGTLFEFQATTTPA